ncbi:hypothetical protein L0337_08185 [candidate division KSB1 bacterium]|nr:hypothetical protein [candidate division KSB1 bacterium]
MIKSNPEKIAGSVSHSNHRLGHLFDAELQYKSGMDAVVPIDNREGDLIGSGEGTVAGEKIRGSIRWSL